MVEEPDPNPKNEEVEDLYDRLEKMKINQDQLEAEIMRLRARYEPAEEFRPEDGVFKRCQNKQCGNWTQVGTKFCPPCRGATPLA